MRSFASSRTEGSSEKSGFGTFSTESPTEEIIAHPSVLVINESFSEKVKSSTSSVGNKPKKSLVRMDSKGLWKACTPKFFRRKSSEYLLGKKLRSSRSQSPNSRKDPNLLQSPEIVRRLSDCGPVTKYGFQHIRFKDPYFKMKSNNEINVKDDIYDSNINVPDISYTPCEDSLLNNNTPNCRNCLNDIQGKNASFDKDELNSEVQELPSNMPRRKSRTGIFDGLYTNFENTRKLRLVHQLSMDETRSDVYFDLAIVAQSNTEGKNPPLPYVGDVDEIIPCSSKRKLFKGQAQSAPTSFDQKICEPRTYNLCPDPKSTSTTMMKCKEMGEYSLFCSISND